MALGLLYDLSLFDVSNPKPGRNRQDRGDAPRHPAHLQRGRYLARRVGQDRVDAKGDAARSELAYAQSGSLVKFLLGRKTPKDLLRFASSVRAGTPVEEAFEKLAGKSIAKTRADWLRTVRALR